MRSATTSERRGRVTETEYIDTAKVPLYIRDELARPLLERAMAYFEQPGVEEAFQAWVVEYRKKKAAEAAN